jgi:cytoskeleton protein RodZ
VPSISPSSAAAAAIPQLPAADTPVTPPETPAADQPRIVVQATADAWLQVRDRNGGVLLNKIMHNGESWPVPLRPNLVLTTGNAGGTQLVVDGVATPVPGGSGAVRRDLPLDADLIKDGRLTQSSGAAAQPYGTAYGMGQSNGTTQSGGTGQTSSATGQSSVTRQTSATGPASNPRAATQ